MKRACVISKTWKKVFIIALCVMGLAALLFAGLMCYVYYDKYHKINYSESWSDQISPTILMEHGYKGMEGFVRLKDIRTGEYTTPRLQHVFVNEYDSEDSLVVFRTHDCLRGYLNIHTGKIIIPAQYNRAWNFKEGIAAVYENGVVSFIDKNGQPAFANTFPIRYDDGYSEIAFQFHNGLCVMRTMNNQWGLINTHGEWVVEPVYNLIDAPIHGYRRVLKGNKYGLITLSGETALPLDYDDIRPANDGNGYIVIKDGIGQEIDENLHVLRPFVYDAIHLLGSVDAYLEQEYYDEHIGEYRSVKPANPRFFRYDLGYNSGVIDAKGKVIIPAIYYNVWLVNDNLFHVQLTATGDYILMDTQGKVVNPNK